MSPTGEWTAVSRPGYFGAKRDAIQAGYDRDYGAGNWQLGWKVGEEFFDREQMTMLYEDSYFEFLAANPDVLDALTSEARDVYDDALSNVHSGLDYSCQETDRTHVQDISIRRCVSRHCRVFEGDQLIQIRDSDGEHWLSKTLSPGRVPFHRPESLVTPELEGWWNPGSIESFYQSNKYLLIRDSVFGKAS